MGMDWKPNEVVTITGTRSPSPRTVDPLTVTADVNGSFQFQPPELVMTLDDVGQTYTLTANGNLGSTAATATFTDANPDNTSMTVSCSPNPIAVGNVTTCTAQVNNIQGGSPTNGPPLGTVNFSTQTPGMAGTFSGDPCTLVAIPSTANSKCSVTFTPSAAVSGTIKGQYNASPNNWNNNNATTTLTVSGALNQTITFGALGNKTWGDADFTVSATATSGLTVTFAASGNCTVSVGTVHLTGAGSCTITASQAGNGSYNPAPNVSQSFNILQKAASVTPNAASKTYGDADPAFTGTLTGFVVADGVTATYSRTTGETVAGSPYTISATLSPAGVLGNYSITYNTAGFTINKKAASVTPDASGKTYGDADPAFTGTLAGFLAADSVTATYSRTTGETVAGGPYTISATLSPAGVLGNYNITSNTAAFTINKRAASVTPNAASKTYGDADPAFTGTLSEFVAADGVTATYSRTTGETVAGGPYTISATLSPAGVLGNYNITYNTAAFTINKRAASVTPNAASKTYGDADPAFTGTLSEFVAADGVTATYSRTTGETVAGGPYTISATLSPAGVLGNYNITYNTAAFTINKRAASVTPDASSKTYGDADPAFTGTLAGFVAGDGVTATYSRTAGETVAGNPYTISATLSPAGVLGNYNITYNTAAFTINKRAASVTPDAASKTYGDADPAFTGTLTGFIAADGVTATYSRTTGETVAGSPYTISASLIPQASWSTTTSPTTRPPSPSTREPLR